MRTSGELRISNFLLWQSAYAEIYVTDTLWPDFRRTDLAGSQFMSVTRKDVVALRLDLTYANNAPGDRVPFYMLPYVGGGSCDEASRQACENYRRHQPWADLLWSLVILLLLTIVVYTALHGADVLAELDDLGLVPGAY